MHCLSVRGGELALTATLVYQPQAPLLAFILYFRTALLIWFFFFSSMNLLRLFLLSLVIFIKVFWEEEQYIALERSYVVLDAHGLR